MYYKMYFCETNAYNLIWAVAADGRACYMIQDGREVDYPTDHEGWAEATEAEREAIASEYLRALGEANGFDDLYVNCEGNSGFVDIATAEDFARDLESGGTLVIAAVELRDI